MMKRTFPSTISKLNILILYLAFFVNSSCDTFDNKLEIINESNDTLFYLVSIADEITYSPVTFKNGRVDYNSSNVILPNKSAHPIVMGKWIDKVASSPDKKLVVYFFSKDIAFMKEDSFLKQKHYLKKKELMLDQLYSSKWKVSFEKKY